LRIAGVYRVYNFDEKTQKGELYKVIGKDGFENAFNKKVTEFKIHTKIGLLI